MEITLRQLRYLIALERHRHFGQAAAAVNVSQPALSVQIKALEDALGAQLIERGKREIVVTPVGREVLQRAHRIERELLEMNEAVRWKRGMGGRLKLGVIPTVAPYLLPAALPLLRSRNGGLDLGVREATTERLIVELRDGELDAIIVALPVDQPDMVSCPLFEDRFLLGGSERLVGAVDEAARPAVIEPERLLLLDDGHCLADQALAACSLRRDQTRMDLRASSLSTLCRLAGEGIGLTFVPELAIRAECAAAPGLTLRRFTGEEPVRRVGLVRRKLTADNGWFSDLEAILAQAGNGELTHARAEYPVCAGEKSHDKPGLAG